MALTKIPRGLLDTGIADSSDATAITIDSSENVTFAGSTTVSGLLTAAGKARITDVGNATVAGLQFTDAGCGIGTPNADQMNFITADNTRMLIDSSGNIGIGGTGNARDELLHLEKSSGTTMVKTEVASNSVVGFNIKKTGSTTQEWKIVDGQTANGKLEIYDVTDSRSVMTFDGAGSVGIGSTAPAAAKFSGSATPVLQVKGATPAIAVTESDVSDAEVYMGMAGGNAYFGSTGSGTLQIGKGTTSTSNAIVIDNFLDTTFAGKVIAPNGVSLGYCLKQTGGTVTPRITNDANNWTILRPGASGADVAINNYANSAHRFIFTDEGVFQMEHAQLSHPTTYAYQTLKVLNTADNQVCIDLHRDNGTKVGTYYGDQNHNQGFLSATYGWVLKVDNNGNVFPTASLGLAGGSNTGLSCELYHPNTSAWQTLGIKNNDDSSQCAIEMFSSQGTKRGIVYGATDYYGFLTQSASWSWKGDASGNWTATGTVTQNSDIRLKENINTIPNALEKVTNLRGVEYTRISTQVKEVGLIAQEVKEVVPELVTITNDKTDADPDGLEDLHSVKYQNTVALLIEAIKELKAEVDELKGNK